MSVFRIHVKQPRHPSAADDVLFYDFIGIFGLDMYVKCVVRDDFYYRSLFAESETSGSYNFHTVCRILPFYGIFQVVGDCVA